MSKELMYLAITRMHLKLNRIIERNNYNLLNNDVQHYSRRLDKVLVHYNRTVEKNSACCLCPNHMKRLLVLSNH